ncbi:hypothetical protein HMPREF1624_02371 [Sporothrix schenckii ATCC 58251]|uniref:Alpha/beta hydrolase fold-3 domain-containing protein n=1 Tax=Sporothrix schenckii (strain ATCC 58251 / de Perez 2211183) TaxID=1391915 RepID=U7Q338_SPOS1|nr:hypothetical protein HMPREF1624_02371 [Sporothrix schenckii ATCC 58251]
MVAHPIEREYADALGLWGWICLVARAVALTFFLALKVVKAAVGGKARRHGQTVYKYTALEGMRDYQYGLSAVRIQNLLPSTKWLARRFARRNKLPFALIHLSNGTTAAVLGPKAEAERTERTAETAKGAKEPQRAKKATGANTANPANTASTASTPAQASSSAPRRAVVVFHGGGYMAPALSKHIHLACGFSKTLPDNVAVYILQYGLASETANQYPRQLQQAAVLLDYLLTAENYPPSAITLVGDSAGGHLALSLLLHLAHPDPQVPAVTLPGGARLAGAALLSPWMITRARSEGLVRANEAKDVLYAAALDAWAQNFLGGPVDESEKSENRDKADAAAADKGSPWSCPLTMPDQWLADLPVDDLFVTYGEDEVLAGNIARFCTALCRARKPVPGVKTAAKGYANELHVHMVMNRFLMLGETCLSEEEFKAWYATQLEAPLRPPPPPPSSHDAVEAAGR